MIRRLTQAQAGCIKESFYLSISDQFVAVTSVGQIDLVHLMEVTSLTKECPCPVTGHAVPITGSVKIVVSHLTNKVSHSTG